VAELPTGVQLVKTWSKRRPKNANLVKNAARNWELGLFDAVFEETWREALKVDFYQLVSAAPLTSTL
jgi:hypothetical protein